MRQHPNPAMHSHKREWLRLLLGFAQMGMVAFSLALLIFSGINRVSLIAAVITCLLTSVSVLLFGSHKGR